MRKSNRYCGVWGVVLVVLGSVAPLHACAPLPVLLYNADVVYRSQGWEVPELPDDAVALMNGESILRADYYDFLYRKVGFDPTLRKDFIISRWLKKQLEAKGVDTDRQKEIIADQFFYFNLRSVYRSCADWVLDNENTEVVETTDFRQKATVLIENSYLKALYILENWNEIYDLGLAEFGVKKDLFDIEGDDEELVQILKLNNAYEMLDVYSSLMSPHFMKIALTDQDLNLPDGEVDFKEWVCESQSTVFLLETYLGMLLSYENAEKEHLEISEKTIEEEFAIRLAAYENQLKFRQIKLPESCVKLAVSETYTDFILQEIRDDLYKSKAYRNATPLKPHEILLRFYEQYGFDGQRCEVHEIYKWVRTRRLPQRLPGYEEYAAVEEARVREELNTIREAILAEGPDSFFTYALTENDAAYKQRLAGLIGAPGSGADPALYDLPVNEVTPIMQGAQNTLDLFLLTEGSDTNRLLYSISKSLPAPGFDFLRHQKNCATAKEELGGLLPLLKIGASIDKLAETYSDNFDRTQGDVSDSYQSNYGFAVAKEIHAIPDGGAKILQLKHGVHLIQVQSREITPYTAEVQEQIVQQYSDELAEQSERYVLAEKLFYEANPYFK